MLFMPPLRIQFSSVQLLSHVQLFVTPGTVACQASLSITNSQSPPKPMSIVSVMPSDHITLWRPLLLLLSIFPSIRVFSNESALCIRWLKYCSFSFSISPSNEYSGLISLRNPGVSFNKCGNRGLVRRRDLLNTGPYNELNPNLLTSSTRFL